MPLNRGAFVGIFASAPVRRRRCRHDQPGRNCRPKAQKRFGFGGSAGGNADARGFCNSCEPEFRWHSPCCNHARDAADSAHGRTGAVTCDDSGGFAKAIARCGRIRWPACQGGCHRACADCAVTDGGTGPANVAAAGFTARTGCRNIRGHGGGAAAAVNASATSATGRCRREACSAHSSTRCAGPHCIAGRDRHGEPTTRGRADSHDIAGAGGACIATEPATGRPGGSRGHGAAHRDRSCHARGKADGSCDRLTVSTAGKGGLGVGC